jgi:hypothetical protein
MKTVAEIIGVSRSNLVERAQERPKKRVGRPPAVLSGDLAAFRTIRCLRVLVQGAPERHTTT